MSTVKCVATLLGVCLLGSALIFMAELPCTVVLTKEPENIYTVISDPATCNVEFKTFGGALYFTFVTLSTVGYGDLTPQTSLGRVLIIFVILFGIAVLPTAIADVARMATTDVDETPEEKLEHVLENLIRMESNMLLNAPSPRTPESMSDGGN